MEGLYRAQNRICRNSCCTPTDRIAAGRDLIAHTPLVSRNRIE